MEAVLLQASKIPEANKAEANKKDGLPWEFNFTISGLRLLPITFITRHNSPQEKSYHSYIREAAIGLWSIESFQKYLFRLEFIWLTVYSGLKQFFR